jgi:iron(III) transport system ATP-binding protein
MVAQEARRVSTAVALEQVTLSYGPHTVLDRVDFRVGEGEVVSVLGPSGSGKTSLLRIVLGFAVPSRGTVRVGGRPATQDGRVLIPPEDRGLAVVFQDLALWPHLSVEGNLAFGLAAQRVPLPERKSRVAAMLRRVGLDGTERRHPGELSGGQRQRVAIARALVLEPAAVLLDEPLANVDVNLRRELLALFRELFSERKTTAIHVTHDLREMTSLTQRFVVLEHGRIVQDGPLSELRRAPTTPFVRSLVEDLGAVPTEGDRDEVAGRDAPDHVGRRHER